MQAKDSHSLILPLGLSSVLNGRPAAGNQNHTILHTPNHYDYTSIIIDHFLVGHSSLLWLCCFFQLLYSLLNAHDSALSSSAATRDSNIFYFHGLVSKLKHCSSCRHAGTGRGISAFHNGNESVLPRPSMPAVVAL